MRHKATIIHRTCPYCGTGFDVSEARLRHGRGEFCSRACKAQNQPKGPKTDTVARFWSKVDKESSPHECWLWMAGTGDYGYGSFWANGRNVGAHAFSYELANGPIPDGLFVCHDCPGGDNPHCVNPAHLFLGTPGDNTRDAAKKGRMPKGDMNGLRIHPDSALKGERNRASKVTAAQVTEIRMRYAAGTETQTDLARRFGVTQTAIWRIVRGHSWKHLP